MPFNGERNLEGSVIQHVNQLNLKLSVTLFQNFYHEILDHFKDNLTCVLHVFAFYNFAQVRQTLV